MSKFFKAAAAAMFLAGLAACGGGDDPPPVAKSIEILSGAGQTAVAGTALAQPVVAVVGSSAGGPLANATVAATVSGGGTLATSSYTTDSTGKVTISGWTLGSTVGTQTLTLTSGAVSASVTATATAPNTCVTLGTTIGATIAGDWRSTDCTDTARGQLYDEYALHFDAQTKFLAQVSGPAGRQLRVYTADGLLVGDQPSDAFAPAAVDPLQLRYALPAGDYRLRVYDPGTSGGAYSLTLSPDFTVAIANPSTCAPVIFSTFGTVVSQSLAQGTSCSFLDDIEDRYILLLQSGDTVTVSVDSTAFAPYLLLRDDRTPTSPVVAAKRLAAPGTATVTYTATFTGFHEIVITSDSFVAEGAYTLSITKQ